MRPVRPQIGNPEPSIGDSSITIGLALRKAIAYALNREEINQVIHNNEMIITNYPINPRLTLWCNPNIIKYDHNLELARQYMELVDCIGCSSTPEVSFPAMLTFLSIFILCTTIVIFRKRIEYF